MKFASILAFIFNLISCLTYSQNVQELTETLVTTEDFNTNVVFKGHNNLFYADFYFENYTDTLQTIDLSSFALEIVMEEGSKKIKPKGYSKTKELFIDPIAPSKLKLDAETEKGYRVFFKYPSDGKPFFIHAQTKKFIIEYNLGMGDSIFLDEYFVQVNNKAFAEYFRTVTEYPDRSLVLRDSELLTGQLKHQVWISNPYSKDTDRQEEYYFDSGFRQSRRTFIDRKEKVIQVWNEAGDSLLVNGTGKEVRQVPYGSIFSTIKDSVNVRSFLVRKFEQDSIYLIPDQRATYPGGMDALYKFVGRNVVIPTKKKNEYIYGKAKVSFIIDEHGTGRDFRVVSDNRGYLGSEIIRILYEMKKWNPAQVDSVEVSSEIELPFIIDLN